MPQGRDRTTGTWRAIRSGRPDTIIDANPGSSQGSLYFAIAASGSGRAINLNGYRDSNRNKRFDPKADAFVGTARVTSLDGVVYDRGLFVAKGARYDAFVGNDRVATGTGIGDWFA